MSKDKENEYWFSWDVNRDLPIINFKDNDTLKKWINTDLQKNNEYIYPEVTIYFITNVLKILRKSIYNFKVNSTVIMLTTNTSYKIVVSLREENYKYCLNGLLRDAINLEQFESCIDISELVKDLDDIRKLFKLKKIKHINKPIITE